MSPTHYAVLGVRPNSTREEIVRAYRALIFKNHPDRVGDAGEAKTVELNAAYTVLTDETRRRQYDRTLLPAPAQQKVTPATSAGRAGGWAPPATAQRYAPQTSKDGPVPTKRDWKAAFPHGSVVRLFWMSIGLLITVAGLTLAVLSTGGLPYAAVMSAAVLLTLTRRPKLVGLMGVGTAAAAGFTGAIMQFPMGFEAGVGLAISALGWPPLFTAARSFRSLRRRAAEARSWQVLTEVSEATGVPVFQVLSVNRNSNVAQIVDPSTGEMRSVASWTDADIGSWVALNAASIVVGTAPETAEASHRWIMKRSARQRRREEKRATPIG